MLAIRQGLVSNYNKFPTFRSRLDEDDYGMYPEYDDYMPTEIDNEAGDRFDLCEEKAQTKEELDLLEQLKNNTDSLIKTTESVPILNKTMRVISALISIAIGWGGLRWGSVGTLEVVSKLGNIRLARSIKSGVSSGYDSVSGFTKKGRDYIKGTDMYSSVSRVFDGWKQAALKTTVGRTVSNCTTAIKANPLYSSAASAINNTITKIKNINPKRVFVETMGVAGGGTAAVNTLGGKSVDGIAQNVEQTESGDYLIDGCNVGRGVRYYDAA